MVLPMPHSHSKAADFGRVFLVGIALNAAYIAVEIVAGVLSGSMALLADAGHNMADVLGLVLAWVAAILAKRTSTERRTYGWKRSTILAALFNALLLLVGVGGVVWESLVRLGQPDHVEGGVVAWVAGLGILVNGFTAWLFLSGQKKDLNVRGAFLHMAADTVVSLGVMLSGIAILLTGWVALDPIVSLLVAGLILVTTWGLFREAISLSMDAVPESIDLKEVVEYLRNCPSVSQVHHVHIWGLSTTETALTAHLVRSESLVDNAFLEETRKELQRRFGIGHATFQIEAAKGCSESGQPSCI